MAEKTLGGGRRFVAIVGPNRSGTSCAAGVLCHLGVWMGERFYWNGYNTYEEYRFKGLIGNRGGRLRGKGTLEEEIVRWLRWFVKQGKYPTVLGAKHPHLCTFWPEMEAVLSRQRFETRVICTNRPVEDSGKSLLRLFGGNLQGRMALPIQLLKAREKYLEGFIGKRMDVNFYDLLDKPRRTVKKIAGFVFEGLEKPSRERISNAVAFVNPSLVNARTEE